MVKALDLRFNVQISAWVRTPLVLYLIYTFKKFINQENGPINQRWLVSAFIVTLVKIFALCVKNQNRYKKN